MLSNEIQKVTGHTTFVGTYSKENEALGCQATIQTTDSKAYALLQNVTVEGLRYGSTATLMTPSVCEAKRR